MPITRSHSAIPFDSIIFATDFSPASQNAGLYASAISARFGIRLMIAHAFSLIQAALEVEAEKPLASQQRINLNRDLDQTAKAVGSDQTLTGTALLEGDPCRVIPVLAQQSSPALIVLGTHGGGSLDRFVLGSTAEGILRHSPGPALTVGPNVNILHAGALNIRRILYATDCTAEAAHAAPVAVALADAFSAELDVLNVTRSRGINHPDQLRRLQEHFYRAVAATLPHNAGHVCSPHSFVNVGQPHTEILNHVTERQIDLLILGLRRNTHLGMQNRTSGAFPIIVESRCPVMTVADGSASQPNHAN